MLVQQAEANPPLVTVVIPTHDRADLLAIALASVVAQHHRPIEVIVVDDGSPSPVVIDHTDQHPQIDLRVVRHDQPKGPAAARNTGLAHATGTYLAFLDDDDEWDPAFLAVAVRSLANGEGRIAAAETTRHLRRYQGDMRTTLHHGHVPSPGQVVLHRADVVEFDPTLRVSEDVEWWARMRDKAVFAWDPEVRYIIREHQGVRRASNDDIRVRCRREVYRRHRASFDRPSRVWHLNRIAAAQLAAHHRLGALNSAIRSFATRPNLLAVKLSARALSVGVGPEHASTPRPPLRPTGDA